MTKWTPHEGQDYAVVMRDDENTETACIMVREAGLAATVADALTKAERADKLANAARDMLRAFGGDFPDWIEIEAEAIAAAILEYGDVTPAFRVRIATGDYDVPWAVQEIVDGKWSTLADYDTKEHARAALEAARAGDDLPKEGML